MEKDKFDKLLKELLIKGINNRYGRISSRREDGDLKEFVSLINREPSILDSHNLINEHILEALFFHYKSDICKYLKLNVRKIENKNNSLK